MPNSKTIRIAAIISLASVFGILLGIYLAIASLLNDQSIMNLLVLRPAVGSNSIYREELYPGVRPQIKYIRAVDGSRLHAWLFLLPGSNQIAIVNHGNAGNISNRTYIANALLHAGSSVLLYDYRGYGLSTGRCSVNGIFQDGDTVYEFAHSDLRYPGSKIISYGESIGTAVSCHVAASRQCQGVIMQSGVGSLISVEKHLFPVLNIYPDFVFAKPHVNNIEKISQVHVPILVCHGKIDRTVPYEQSQMIFDHANEPKTLVYFPNCGHNDVGVHDGELFQKSITNFVHSLNKTSEQKQNQ